MRDASFAVADWATERRSRWSPARIAAAMLLHLLMLSSLKLAIDRVEMPRHGNDRLTTLVSVVLHAAPPPSLHALPLPPSPARANTRAPAARAPVTDRPRAGATQAITLPAPARTDEAVVVASPAASSPRPDSSFLDGAATRQAIRSAARGDTLASRASALTHEEPGSELLAADGTHCDCTRNLPPPPPAQLLAHDIAAAHKGDCMKGEYPGGGMGLLSAPFLLAAEAMGSCAHKL